MNTIAIASDHRGVSLKQEIILVLKKEGFEVKDLGTNSDVSVDYPDYAMKAAEAVQKHQAEKGIVICHSGIGVSIVANKIKGIRAALCQTVEQAELSRKHTDSNVLALPAGFVMPDLAKKIVTAWLHTDFEGGRHQMRIEKISKLEENRK